MFVYNWSIDEAYGDLSRAGIEPASRRRCAARTSSRSRRSRSAEGAAILAIDPHLSWDGPEPLLGVPHPRRRAQGSGMSLAGAPYLGIGHTRNLAWAMTTGGPDTADVYELKLDAAGARYRYDGEWRALERAR